MHSGRPVVSTLVEQRRQAPGMTDQKVKHVSGASCIPGAVLEASLVFIHFLFSAPPPWEVGPYRCRHKAQRGRGVCLEPHSSEVAGLNPEATACSWGLCPQLSRSLSARPLGVGRGALGGARSPSPQPGPERGQRLAICYPTVDSSPLVKSRPGPLGYPSVSRAQGPASPPSALPPPPSPAAVASGPSSLAG